MTDVGEYPPAAAALGHKPELATEPAQTGSNTIIPLGDRPGATDATDLASCAAAFAVEAAALAALGFSKPFVTRLAADAERNGTTLETELLGCGEVLESAYYGAIARAFRLPMIEAIDPSTVQDLVGIDAQLLRPTQVRINHRHLPPQVAIVPEAGRLAEFSALLIRLPELGRGLAITTPSALRSAVWATGSGRRVKTAVTDLFDREPQHSARIVATGRQGMIAGCLTTGLFGLCLAAPDLILPLLHVTLSGLYLSGLLLRIVAVVQHKRHRNQKMQLPSGPLPCYTVMVALYHEAAMAAQLVSSLERLDWPRSLLDVKLICEADDLETIDALRRTGLPPNFEIVEVPACHPRTKPKALTYALAGARGLYLAVYDAEDRPHPQQLMEACSRFRSRPAKVACLQAPLIIANLEENKVSTMFAVEYAALFRGLLPMLARYRMPMPLGGTSNHFRTDVLREVGGWDPFNVTEDADLGLRLYRKGYRSETLRCQTLEDAPVLLSVWTGQRTRWFKGWLQTWLVMTRHPITTARQMGLRATLVFHLLVGGMLISALLHPLILVFLGHAIFMLVTRTVLEIPISMLALMLVDTANVFGSYATFLALGVGSMIEAERRKVGWRWTAVPLHWLMNSYAAWRAVNELRTNPFFWKKTPHRPSHVATNDDKPLGSGE